MSPPASPSWEHYQTFLAVMAGGSLSAAARALKVAQPTVRRRIEALESSAGAVLFTRDTAGLTPTDAARAMLPHAQEMATSAQALQRALSGAAGEDRGTVRLTASEVMGGEVLPALLRPLLQRHPRLQVELVLSNRTQDLLRREADVAVRMVAPTQAALVARKVGRVAVGLFARADYLKGRPPVHTLQDLLRGHALIGQDRETGLLEALGASGLPLSARDFTVRTDNDLAQLAAVRAGLGVGVAQLALAGRDPRLVRLLPRLEVGLDTFVVMHEDLKSVRRVRLVFEHLVAALGAHARRR